MTTKLTKIPISSPACSHAIDYCPEIDGARRSITELSVLKCKKSATGAGIDDSSVPWPNGDEIDAIEVRNQESA
jgi:hypothetical protein